MKKNNALKSKKVTLLKKKLKSNNLGKPVKDSQLETTYMVLPEHTNALGNIFGGTIMSWIDVTASIVAFRHCRSVVVTAAMDEMSFLHPVHMADLVTLKASVNFTSDHSVEVGVKVEAEDPVTGETNVTSTAYLTFVSLDSDGRVLPVPPAIPETALEKQRFLAGQKRYEERRKKRNSQHK